VVVGARERADATPIGAAAEAGEPGTQGRRACHDVGGELVLGARRQSVADLPQVEQEQQRFELLRAQTSGDDRERMGEAVRDALPAQVVDELEHVESETPDLAVLLFVDPPDEDVDVERLGREERRDLFADDEVVVVSEPQGAFDRVVVGQGDVRHAAGLGKTIDGRGFRVRLAQPQLGGEPHARRRRVARVTVEIDAHCVSRGGGAGRARLVG